MAAIDIINRQDTVKKFTEEFILCPQFWSNFKTTHALNWTATQLTSSNRPKIPKKSGIYTLIVQPGIATHPACSFLIYVGQTKELNRRFGEYLGAERTDAGRPKVLRFLNIYDKHIWFCFTEVDKKHLDEVEDSLITAYVPPANDDIAAQVRSGRKPF